MSFKVDYDIEENILNTYDFYDFKINLNDIPVKYEVEEVSDAEFYEYLGLTIIKPINGGEDFIFKFQPKEHVSPWIECNNSFIGRSFGDLFPPFKDFYYTLFRKVIKTHCPEKITANLYENNIKLLESTIDLIYKNGDIYISNLFKPNEFYSRLELNKFLIANEYVQKASRIAIHYMDKEGKYHWSPEVYNLIEREPRDDDKNNHIILDLYDEEDRIKMENNIAKLGSDEFIGEITYKITLESGKVKYVKTNSHKLYDNQGNYIKRNAYTQDVTEEYLKNNKLKMLNDVFKLVQEATLTSVDFFDAEGKYHWSDETYKLIDREPRDGDEEYDIILAYTNKDTHSKLIKLMDELEFNKFLGEQFYSIITANGEKKYLKIDAYKVADKNGDFLRTIRYTQDITEDYLKNKELLTLKSVVEDVQKSAVLSVQYMDANGKYHWTDETYKIIDREPREGDENTHIVGDLMIEKDAKAFKQLIDDLKPNEYYNDDKIWTIITESGNVKYILGKAHKIYDEEGNFIRRSEFAQDVTEDYLKSQEFSSLNAVVKDVQEAASIGIYYRDSQDKWHYSDEIYNIIDREPRDGDENTHIIADLMDSSISEIGINKIKNLKPGETLDGLGTWPIITESGKLKYLRGNVRIIHDEEGNFIRQSEFAQDITDQFNYQQELIQADKDKTVLVQEVHHRVKNNLQLITSFINLEKKFHKDDPERILEITEKRLTSLAMIHERIYSEENMSFIEIKPFFNNLDKHLFMFSSSDDINFVNVFEDGLKLSIDVVTPLSLMVNELTTNTFKYAFPGNFTGKKEIYKSINTYNKNDSYYVKCIYKDSGVGLPNDFDIETTPSLGWMIIRSLVDQLDGEFKLFNDNGLNFIFNFPLK